MKSILHIEDSLTSQVIVRRTLGDGYALTVAASPRAAQVLLSQHNYDLVITDVNFPQGDAFQFIVPLRQRRSAIELPLIAVSGSMDAPLMNRLLKAGVNICFSKPLVAAEFRSAVERMLLEPFIAKPPSSTVSVACFRWVEAGIYHEYCPEADCHLHGPDSLEVSQRMQAVIAEHAAQGGALGFTNTEHIHHYRGKFGPTESTLAVPVGIATA
jgi:CheY-like chemotaxis protein